MIEQVRGIIVTDPSKEALARLEKQRRKGLIAIFKGSREMEKLMLSEALAAHAQVLSHTGTPEPDEVCKNISKTYWEKPLEERVSHMLLLQTLDRETRTSPNLNPRAVNPTR